MDRFHGRDLRKGRWSIEGQVYLITFITDSRKRVFESFESACVAARNLSNEYKGFDLLAWVLMPDHFHGLMELKRGNLAGCVRSLKGGSARAVNRCMGVQGRLWQPGYYDRAIRSTVDIRAAARYIVANPLRAGLVDHIGDYPYWNAVWL